MYHFTQCSEDSHIWVRSSEFLSQYIIFKVLRNVGGISGALLKGWLMVRHLGNAVPEALALLDGEEGVAVVGVALLEAGIVDVLQECRQRVASLSSHIVLGQRILLEQLNTSLDLLLWNELLNWHGWSSASIAALIEVLIAL